MIEFYMHDGDVWARAEAGGHGGGVSSWFHRPATAEEAAAYRAQNFGPAVEEEAAPEPEVAAEPTEPSA